MNINQRNKLVIPFLLIVSAIFVFCTGRFTVQKIQEEMYNNYSNFGQLVAKTLSIQGQDLIKNNKFESYIDKILKDNEDVSFIAIKDNNGNIIFSKENSKNNIKINVTSPIIDSNGKINGSIELGLSANSVNYIQTATKKSIFLVFALGWIAFALILILNAVWATRELSILYKGVKEIENGKFGTKIINSDEKGDVGELYKAFNEMSQKLHLYEEQNIDTLTIEKNKLEAVLMSIANGVVVCDNSDNITILNNAALTILNVDEKDILNTKIQEYCDTEGENSFNDKIEEFKNTPLDIMEKKPLEFSISIGERVIKALISPVYSKVHDYLGYIIILIDMTREAEVDKLKSDFISNVSHELRTPVTVLRSYADTLYNYGDEFKFEEQKEFIGTINQEVIRLNKMVNDILDFSKFQNNELEKETQDIMPVIEDVVQSLKVLAEERHLNFSIKKEENLPEIPFNRGAISRVITNLVTNAIKYSNEETTIQIETSIEENKFIKISVKDSGCGIDAKHLPKIFDRFYRVENKTHTVKGTGLGLNLVKIAVEKHHQGKVFVQSEINVGSTFGFMLPINPTEINETLETQESVQI
ncbi:MAG: cell wall metabolism sensor histidine kinase WalK [Cyanobacteria bacterium SIG30]|nr:cell wall metabolism sensor histidine kinase WalK [Cyanobacteria bacterium SIG30]